MPGEGVWKPEELSELEGGDEPVMVTDVRGVWMAGEGTAAETGRSLGEEDKMRPGSTGTIPLPGDPMPGTDEAD